MPLCTLCPAAPVLPRPIPIPNLAVSMVIDACFPLCSLKDPFLTLWITAVLMRRDCSYMYDAVDPFFLPFFSPLEALGYICRLSCAIERILRSHLDASLFRLPKVLFSLHLHLSPLPFNPSISF